MENREDIIYLKDEDGLEHGFEYLDSIEYNQSNYIVLLPLDSEEEEQEVVILKVVENSDQDEEYLPIESESELETVFEIFKENMKDRFDFIDDEPDDFLSSGFYDTNSKKPEIPPEYKKSYLSSFIAYCENENLLNEKRDSNFTKINMEIMKAKWAEMKKDAHVILSCQIKKPLIWNLFNDIVLMHHTSVDSVINILKHKAVMSIKAMEKSDIDFNYRISINGINEELHNYVFVKPFKGDWIYGLCRIIFKKEVLGLKNAYFTPESCLNIQNQKLKDHLFDLNDLLIYMKEHISLSSEDPSEYFEVTPVYKLPDILFEEKIPEEYIEKIVVKGKDTYDILRAKIIKEIGMSNPYIKILEYE